MYSYDIINQLHIKTSTSIKQFEEHHKTHILYSVKFPGKIFDNIKCKNV
jgi:hypothetical protein